MNDIPFILDRQQLVLLKMLAQGHGSKAMGRTLGISDKTVRSYLSRLYARIGVANGRAAVAWYMTRDTTSLEDILNVSGARSQSGGSEIDRWYLQCLAKGRDEIALAQWELEGDVGRRIRVRYPAVLMMLLTARNDEASSEMNQLADAQRVLAQSMHQWLRYGSMERLMKLREQLNALPRDSQLKACTSLAMYRIAHAMGECRVALEVANFLYNEIVDGMECEDSR